jgi:hypothetical protein
MIVQLAYKTLVAHPVRASVLGIGFGLGVGVMATLLGVGEVVLDQARAPALAGGGQLVVSGFTGAVTSARFVMAGIAGIPGATPSPRKRADLFLVRNGRTTPIRARGGIPSLERAVRDPETSAVPSWTDTEADRSWVSPDPGEVLRAMDRFHPIPDVPARAGSWAEWLYFKGQSGDVQFYLTFLVGPMRDDGRRAAGVRLQLDRGGRQTSHSIADAVDAASLIASAPDITIGANHVRLDGLRYRMTLDLPGVKGEIIIEAIAGRSLAPIVLRGANGWLSGYTVPVMSGRLGGELAIGGDTIHLDGAAYHDHNWGFWQGVTWRWGQVQHEGRSYVYGRVYPPADAADPERLPGFLVALGPDGPVGYSTRVDVDETDDPTTGRPRRIVVRARGRLDLTMDIAVDSAIVNRGGALARGPDFLQLRGRYHVTGRVGKDSVDFTAGGAAETFRGAAEQERGEREQRGERKE